MSHQTLQKIISMVCIFALLLTLGACGRTDPSADKADPATSDTASPDTAVSFTDPDVPTVTLSADTDWQSLYYEHLRALDSEIYPRCALLYLNNDEVPELFLDTDQADHYDLLAYVTEDGLFVTSQEIMEKEATDFTYLEKTGRFLLHNKGSQTINNVADKSTGKATTQKTRNAWLCYYTGESLDISYYLTEDRLGGGDPYTKISDQSDAPAVSVNNDLSATIKDYYDTDQAKSPDYVTIGALIDNLKSQRKTPDVKTGGYNGDVTSLVSTYKDVGGKVTVYGKEKTLYYRIPQIDLEGERIEAINSEIIDLFDKGVDLVENADSKQNGSPEFLTVDYSVYGYNGVLSLVISAIGFGGTDSPDQHFIFNIDINAGKEIGNLCLLNSYEVDPQLIKNAFAEQVKPFFTKEQYSSEVSEDIIEDLYESTVEDFSPVDDFNRMYFDEYGNPTVLYRHHQLAGASYVEKALTLYP